MAQWNGIDLLCPRLSEEALILISTVFVEEADEGADVEELDEGMAVEEADEGADMEELDEGSDVEEVEDGTVIEVEYLRGTGIGGIMAFFLVLLSSTVEKTSKGCEKKSQFEPLSRYSHR